MKDLKSFKKVLFTVLLGAFILVNCQSNVFAYGITSIGGSGWSGTLNYSANSTIYLCYGSSVTLYTDVTASVTVGSTTYYRKWQTSGDGVSWVTTSYGGSGSMSTYSYTQYYRCVQRSTGGVVLAGSETPWVRIMFGPSFVQMPSAVSTTDVSGTSFTAHWTTSITPHGPGNLAIRHWMFCSTTPDFQSNTQAPGFNTACAKLITACSEGTSAIAGCTNPSTAVSYTVTGLTPGVTYYWKVIAQSYHEESSNGDLYCGVQSSYTGTQTVNSCPPPVITAQPLAQTVCEGQSVSFSVTATGATSYQWQLTGSDISGATNSSYSIPSASSGNEGNYQCIVTNACGSDTTIAVALTIGTEVTPAFSAIGPYCVGATPGTLPATSTNGITGTWAPATITTGTSGTTTYTFTPTAGQCATTASVPVTVSDPVTPVITGTTSLCTGSTATWTGSIPGGSWTSETPGAATAGSTTGLITGVAAGTSVITYSVSSGGCVNTATQTVTISVSTPQTITGTNPVCLGSTATWTGTSPGGTWTSDAQIIATIDPVTGLVSGINTGTSLITYAVNVGGCVNTATETVLVSAVLPTDVTVAANPAGPVCSGTVVQFTATPQNGGVTPTYEWYKFGTHVGSNSPVYVDSNLVIGDKISCRMTSGQSCVSGNPGLSDTIFMIVKPSLIASIGIEGSANAPCESLPVDFTATPVNGGTSPAFQWYLNTTPVSTTSIYTNNSLVTGDSIRCRLTSNEACVVNNPTWSNTIHISVSPVPTAEAGANASYTGTPVVLGDPSNGPGTFSWSPATGLSDPAIAQPTAAPAVTTTYTLSVNNNGCISTDVVTITVGGSGHSISGKTVYAGKANAGNPVPNNPTYNPVIYAINQVIVVLKSYPANDELARDTSDASGMYQFTNVADGNYILTYDKYTADTMLWGNDVTAIDVALLKYFIGSDSLQDPTRCFSLRYKTAANVDNNASINAVDVARIKAKVGAPYDVSRNFPRGNWVAFDKPVTVAGSDLNVNLETICYGDYNASSSKYRDSLTSWSGAKSIPADIIVTSEDFVTTGDAGYFELPLRMSSKMNEFSALGLELNYPEGYQLVSAYMPAAVNKSGIIKINQTLEEIISSDNDLLVTDDGRVIRVVFATTDHFDVVAGDVMIVLGFRAINKQSAGTAEFTLSGTGVIGNQYGEVNNDTYLIMPRVLIQGSTNETGFEFAGYPNPFSGDATLTYQIPENGTVNIKVFNAIGELVTVLIDESQLCGKHTVEFSGKDFPAGIYSFKLEFEGLRQSGHDVLKMIR